MDKFIVKYVLCVKCKYPEVKFEGQKKKLVATCNACGTQKELDTQHKAGKQLLKDIDTFYKNNPEFQGKGGTVQAKQEMETQPVSSKKLGGQEQEPKAAEAVKNVSVDSAEIGKFWEHYDFRALCRVVFGDDHKYFVTTYLKLADRLKYFTVLQY